MSDLDIIREIEEITGLKSEEVDYEKWDERLDFVNPTIVYAREEADIVAFKIWQSIFESNISISNIQESFFKAVTSMKNLKRLNLERLSISEFPEAICSLTTLTELKLCFNMLSALPDSIAKLTSLNTFDLDTNQFTNFPESICNILSLTQLSLNSNQLSSLPISISKLTVLTNLAIHHNQFIQFPEAICNLNSLVQLSLSGNQLSSLPQSFSKLTNLAYLDLDRNQFAHFPGAIEKISSLVQLSLSGNQLSSLPNSISTLTALAYLYLNDNQFTHFPEAIEKINSLVELNLGSNRFSSIPTSISNLSSLRYLHLNGNQFTHFPEAISNLNSLVQLSLFNNQLSSLPDSFSKLTALTKLDLNNNQLSSLPDSFSTLAALVHLGLDNNQLSSLPDSFSKLTSLTHLYLNNNQLSSLPDSFSKLTSLTHLYLNNNQLSFLPDSFSKLTALTKLELNNNQLSSLPDSFFKLTTLTDLALDSNQFTHFPEAICNLNSLIQLNLSYNQLSSLPDSFFKLTTLTDLALDSNQFIHFPEAICNLNSLIQLNLSYNQLSSVPDSISKLTSLTMLNLSRNIFTQFPENICCLTTLTYLGLGENKIYSIPNSISRWTSLKRLYLEDNKLSSIPDSISKLANLKSLTLYNNQIVSLPKCIFESMEDLIIDDNPLESPPMEIVKNGREAILEYFREIEAGERIPLNEVKVVLIGNGEAGKTNLVRRFFGEQFVLAHDKTDGVSIRHDEYEVHDKKIKVHYWDFGGQEIMHSTHQFFLTKKTVYILVLDARKDERPENWLGMVKTFADDSPVFVVMNKIDQNEHAEMDRKNLNDKYPSIKNHFFRISCNTGEGIEDLKNRLKEVLYDMPSMKSYWSQAWTNIKIKMETSPDNYINYEDYVRFCEEEKLSETSSKVLLGYLHNLGLILHFEDIPDKKVLKASWVTEGIYKIINYSGNLSDSDKAVVNTLTDLPNILDPKKYLPSSYDYLVKLMKKFELCYSVSEHKILIPDRLSIEEPDHLFDKSKSLQFVFEYKDYLPPNVIVRFIVEKNHEIYKNQQWKSGVILYHENFKCYSYIRSDSSEKRLYVYVSGDRQRDCFTPIWNSIKNINKDYKTEIQEKIPIPKTKHLIQYQALLNYEKKGELRPYIGEIDQNINVTELLNGYESPAVRKERLEKETSPTIIVNEGGKVILTEGGDNFEGDMQNPIIKSSIKTKTFIQQKNEGINAEQLKEIIQTLSSEFQKQKTSPHSVEEKINELYKLIEQSVQSSFKNSEHFEKNVLKKWLPDYKNLDPLSMEYLLSAEFLFDSIYRSNGKDYSPFILQYCRAVENELKKRIFESFRNELHRTKTDLNTFLEWDLNKQNKNSKFAEAVKKTDSVFMLGDMLFYLGRAKDTTLMGSSPLIQEFRNFLNTNFDINEILSDVFSQNILKMKEFRNQAAHPEDSILEMDQNKASNLRTLVQGILKNWLDIKLT